MCTLGNERPGPLLEAEDALWSTFKRIANGSTAETEITAFLSEYNGMRERWQTQGVDLQLDFFQNGMHPVPSIPKLTC